MVHDKSQSIGGQAAGVRCSAYSNLLANAVLGTMASTEATGNEGSEGRHLVVEMVEPEIEAASTAGDRGLTSHEITPLLSAQNDMPKKINIFSISYPRRKPREQVTKLTEAEISVFTNFILWAWGGSRYSGLMCMAFSSTVYCIMGAISEIFTAQPIPLFETAFGRCTIILMLSYGWLQHSGQPIFGPAHVRKLLLARAVVGSLSLLSFVYSIQRLPLSQSIVLTFASPILASIMARFILQEKLTAAEIGGLTCSFCGVLFIFLPTLSSQDDLAKSGESSSNAYAGGSYHFYLILLGLFSSISGGFCYCLIRASAKGSDQPVVTVFLFSLFASPAAALCTFVFQEFVFPSFYSVLLMIALGALAFLAEVFLARGLYLEKTSKAVNILYLEAALSQLLGVGFSGNSQTFGRLSGGVLILISVCCTMYFGMEKATEQEIERI